MRTIHVGVACTPLHKMSAVLFVGAEMPFDCPIHLKYPGAHSTWGLLMRVAAKVVAYNVGMMINRLLGRPDFAFAALIV